MPDPNRSTPRLTPAHRGRTVPHRDGRGGGEIVVGVLLGDAVGVSEGELDEVSGTVLGSGPAAGAGLLVEQPPSTAIPSNAAAAPGFQTGWIVTASPPFASFSPAAAHAPSVSAAAIPYASPSWRLTPARQVNAFKSPIAVGQRRDLDDRPPGKGSYTVAP